jgi:hypothetical protein
VTQSTFHTEAVQTDGYRRVTQSTFHTEAAQTDGDRRVTQSTFHTEAAQTDGDRRVTQSTFRTEVAQTDGDTFQNLFLIVTWHVGFSSLHIDVITSLAAISHDQSISF